MANSLQAVLDKKKLESEIVTKKPKKEAAPVKEMPQKKTAIKKQGVSKTRENTILIGGHFPKEVAKQLKFLAIEEETSNQKLLQEALDLLFIKKGKLRIDDLKTV